MSRHGDMLGRAVAAEERASQLEGEIATLRDTLERLERTRLIATGGDRMDKGDRVGAVLKAKNKTIHLIGYGTYQGPCLPSECEQKPVGGFGTIIAEENVENPLILLDSGDYVWGCECWWGSEKTVRKRVETFAEVIEVDIVQHRADTVKSWNERASSDPQ
jgi:hypothetical protein